MARVKHNRRKMTTKIDSNLMYDIYTNMLARKHKRPTSSRRLMNSTIEHLTQINTPVTCPQQPRNTRIW
jgi:hypothetical protein